ASDVECGLPRGNDGEADRDPHRDEQDADDDDHAPDRCPDAGRGLGQTDRQWQSFPRALSRGGLADPRHPRPAGLVWNGYRHDEPRLGWWHSQAGPYVLTGDREIRFYPYGQLLIRAN